MAKDEKALLSQAKNLIAKFKSKNISKPESDTSKFVRASNDTESKMQPRAMWGAVAWAIEAPELLDAAQQKFSELKHGDTNTEQKMSAGNMTEHDEDVDNLVLAMASFLPAGRLEEWATQLLGWLLKKLWGKKFAPEIVDAVMAKRMKPAWFTSKKLEEAWPRAKRDSRVDNKPAYERWYWNASARPESKVDMVSKLEKRYWSDFYSNPEFLWKFTDEFN